MTPNKEPLREPRRRGKHFISMAWKVNSLLMFLYVIAHIVFVSDLNALGEPWAVGSIYVLFPWAFVTAFLGGKAYENYVEGDSQDITE